MAWATEVNQHDRSRPVLGYGQSAKSQEQMEYQSAAWATKVNQRDRSWPVLGYGQMPDKRLTPHGGQTNRQMIGKQIVMAPSAIADSELR